MFQISYQNVFPIHIHSLEIWMWKCENLLRADKMKSNSREIAHNSFIIGHKMPLSLQSQEALHGIICYREME